MSKERDLVSMTICTYNQERYIRDCIESALAQDYSPFEIVISDDVSSDSTFDIIKDVISNYEGPHKIILNKNDSNVGIGANVSKAVSLSHGKLIVDCAGDDVFEPNKVSELYKVWDNNGKKGMAFFSNAIIIDEYGNEKGFLFKNPPRHCSVMNDFLSDKRSLFEMAREPSVWIHGATAAYSREIFDSFGPIPKGVRQEDGVLSFRALLLGGIRYVDKPLCKYRIHSDSISNRTNYHNVVKMMKSEYLYFRTQLEDARKVNADANVLKKIKKMLYFSYIKHYVFSIPLLNLMIVKTIKKF